MKNDRLIMKLIKEGRLTADLGKGLVFLDGKQKGWKIPSGYLVFKFRQYKKRRVIRCHRVVWMVGTGKLPHPEWEVDHLLGIDKTDNRFKKLELIPGCVNVRRAWDNGLCSSGNNHCVRDPETGAFVKDLEAAPF